MKVDTRENSLGNFGKCNELVLIINVCQNVHSSLCHSENR